MSDQDQAQTNGKTGSVGIGPTLLTTPNIHARPPRLELCDHSAFFHGYQEFILTRNSLQVLTEDPGLLQKQRLLAAYFTPHFLKYRTVLDLGANSAFFCFWALQQGATAAAALDIDPAYLEMVEKAKTHFGFDSLKTHQANVADWAEPADIVVALALIHWIYTCTAVMGSLDLAVKTLAKLTRYMLLVEWVDPADEAISFFHHLEFNPRHVREPYTLKEFEAALGRHFAWYYCIGEVSPTRKLYAAFPGFQLIDLASPFPFLRPIEKLLSSQFLCTNEGVDYWSLVYDDGDAILKQATLDLAEREAKLLLRLDSPYFPRVREWRREGQYSVIILEKVQGASLKESVDAMADRERFFEFIMDGLNILEALQAKGITHRDIRPGNILMREGKPVLIDFGWSITEDMPTFTPPLLGASGRSPDGNLCDIYSMGMVFSQMNRGRHQTLEWVIRLMAAPERRFRITDLATLRTLFRAAAGKEVLDKGGEVCRKMDQ